MNIRNVISASIKGTSAMSLFSYLVSHQKGKNFKEPELLGTMVRRVTDIEPGAAEATGWGLHYLAGYVFAAVYAEVLERTGVKPTVANGIITGAASGIPAVLIWYTMFKLHPDPPKERYASYFKHLVAAHAIFGAYTFANYKKERSGILARDEK